MQPMQQYDVNGSGFGVFHAVGFLLDAVFCSLSRMGHYERSCGKMKNIRLAKQSFSGFDYFSLLLVVSYAPVERRVTYLSIARTRC